MPTSGVLTLFDWNASLVDDCVGSLVKDVPFPVFASLLVVKLLLVVPNPESVLFSLTVVIWPLIFVHIGS